MRIGYARVSTGDQSLDLQLDALAAAGCDPEHIYTDKLSSVKTKQEDRPGLQATLKDLRAGDTLVIWKLDRLGRSTLEIIALVTALHERQVDVVTLNDHFQIDTTTATGKFIFQLFAALAELEASVTRERTEAGLASARARGRLGGRKPKLSKHQVSMMQQMYDSREYSIYEICKQFDVARTTFYRLVQVEPQKQETTGAVS